MFRLPPRTEVQLAFLTDRRMRALNRRTRNVDHPTDVLAFPVHPVRVLRRLRGDPTAQTRSGRKLGLWPRDPDGMFRVGTVAISVETARRQAEGRKTSAERELAELFAHGFLHLLGHDHAQKGPATVMEELQRRLTGNGREKKPS